MAASPSLTRTGLTLVYFGKKTGGVAKEKMHAHAYVALSLRERRPTGRPKSKPGRRAECGAVTSQSERALRRSRTEPPASVSNDLRISSLALRPCGRVQLPNQVLASRLAASCRPCSKS